MPPLYIVGVCVCVCLSLFLSLSLHGAERWRVRFCCDKAESPESLLLGMLKIADASSAWLFDKPLTCDVVPLFLFFSSP